MSVIENSGPSFGPAAVSAFIKFQSEVDKITKDKKNPHFQSKYTSLAQVISIVTPTLNDNGLMVTQLTDVDEYGPQLVTRLYHESGDYIESRYPLKSKDDNDPQKVGSAMTYARRYGLLSIAGLAPEDDDGNAAATPKPNPLNEKKKELAALAGTKDPQQLAAFVKPYSDKELGSLTVADIDGILKKASATKEPIPF